VALDLGLGIELCWPQPAAEGLGRESGGLGQGSFFKQRRFLDHEDLLSSFASG
jgi:hypothetical protein